MDDKNFTTEDAKKWSKLIEQSGTSVRDKDIYPHIGSWLSGLSEGPVLDLGCGQGICADKLSIGEREYWGVDASPTLLSKAKEKYQKGNIQFKKGNIYNIPFAENTFSGCFSLAVWHLIEGLAKANSQISKVLKPGGQFLIITANLQKKDQWLSAYDHVEQQGDKITGMNIFENKASVEDVLYLRSEEKLLEAFAKADLQVNLTTDIRLWKSFSGVYNPL